MPGKNKYPAGNICARPRSRLFPYILHDKIRSSTFPDPQSIHDLEDDGLKDVLAFKGEIREDGSFVDEQGTVFTSETAFKGGGRKKKGTEETDSCTAEGCTDRHCDGRPKAHNLEGKRIPKAAELIYYFPAHLKGKMLKEVKTLGLRENNQNSLKALSDVSAVNDADMSSAHDERERKECEKADMKYHGERKRKECKKDDMMNHGERERKKCEKDDMRNHGERKRKECKKDDMRDHGEHERKKCASASQGASMLKHAYKVHESVRDKVVAKPPNDESPFKRC